MLLVGFFLPRLPLLGRAAAERAPWVSWAAGLQEGLWDALELGELQFRDRLRRETVRCSLLPVLGYWCSCSGKSKGIGKIACCR